MIISLALIIAVILDIHPLVLWFLLITWIPDIAMFLTLVAAITHYRCPDDKKKKALKKSKKK